MNSVFLLTLLGFGIAYFIWRHFVDHYQDGDIIVPNDPHYVGKHRLTLYFFRSPTGVNWTSPRALFLSTLRNLISPHNRMISHVALEVQGPHSFDERANPYYRFTSKIDLGKKIFKHLFQEQVGLGMILLSYKGSLEPTGLLQNELREKRKQGRVQSITYIISEESAFRLQKYLKEYVEVGNDKIYAGLASHPRYLEGAGCMAFCKAATEVVGLDQDITQKTWMTSIDIPQNLIGNSIEKHKVPITKILFSSEAKRWAHKHEPHVSIEFWDIDRIFHELKFIAEKKKRNESLPEALNHYQDLKIEIRKHDRSYEIILDRTQIAPPTEPLWLKR
ncbi:MAG: hypothetical protein H6621_01070 [Halobacteriovoraceae bacterium]|nr:hypothetical protein [Halobacteriovoraceae bacterium]MCB9093633.1 hypothetical protein [Halobacteriovoraceae bacterium]